METAVGLDSYNIAPGYEGVNLIGKKKRDFGCFHNNWNIYGNYLFNLTKYHDETAP